MYMDTTPTPGDFYGSCHLDRLLRRARTQNSTAAKARLNALESPNYEHRTPLFGRSNQKEILGDAGGKIHTRNPPTRVQRSQRHGLLNTTYGVVIRSWRTLMFAAAGPPRRGRRALRQLGHSELARLRSGTRPSASSSTQKEHHCTRPQSVDADSSRASICEILRAQVFRTTFVNTVFNCVSAGPSVRFGPRDSKISDANPKFVFRPAWCHNCLDILAAS